MYNLSFIIWQSCFLFELYVIPKFLRTMICFRLVYAIVISVDYIFLGELETVHFKCFPGSGEIEVHGLMVHTVCCLFKWFSVHCWIFLHWDRNVECRCFDRWRKNRASTTCPTRFLSSVLFMELEDHGLFGLKRVLQVNVLVLACSIWYLMTLIIYYPRMVISLILWNLKVRV